MNMNEADIIGYVRSLRKLVAILDSIGFPIFELSKDEELGKLITNKLILNTNITTDNIHKLIQRIEKSKRYKEAVRNMCGLTIGDMDD